MNYSEAFYHSWPPVRHLREAHFLMSFSSLRLGV